jgi:acyl-CoA oxidase
MGGFATTDNGFARFDHVRIPKENMLSKFAGVTDEGKYVTPPHAKLSYGGVRLSFRFTYPRSELFFSSQMLYIRSGCVVPSVFSKNEHS